MESAVAVRTTCPTAEPEPPIETPSLEILYSNSMLQLETLLERSPAGVDDLIWTGTEIALLTEWIEEERAELEETRAEWEMFSQREENANLRREAEAETGRFSSTPWKTDVVPNEKTVLEQLNVRNFNEGEERHGDEEEICSVCLEDLYRGAVGALDCRHEFHVKCITKWLVGGENCCPLCRATALDY